MSTNLIIKLKRVNKVYHEGETIAGVAAVESSSEVRHEGLTLTLEGVVNLQLSTKNVGIFEAFSNSIKPINLLNTSIELAPPGRIPPGVTEIPFEMPLRARQAVSPGYPGLLETYHGVFVNIMYILKCSMKRSFLNKPLNVTSQIFVQHPQQERAPLKPVRCEISPSTIRAGGGGGARANMPHFQVYAEIDSTVCPLDLPITGKIRVDECSVPIKSIELQLVRVETCGCAEGYSRDGACSGECGPRSPILDCRINRSPIGTIRFLGIKSLCVNPGYKLSPFKISCKSVVPLECEEVTNLQIHKLSHL